MSNNSTSNQRKIAKKQPQNSFLIILCKHFIILFNIDLLSLHRDQNTCMKSMKITTGLEMFYI